MTYNVFGGTLHLALSIYLNLPNRASKTQNARFSSKIALQLKKVCYKVSLCENCQRQTCKAFVGLTIRAKMISGWRPLVPGSNWPRWSDIADFRSLFARSDSAITGSEKRCSAIAERPRSRVRYSNRCNSPYFAFSHRIR